jgi:hypothetical protein
MSFNICRGTLGRLETISTYFPIDQHHRQKQVFVRLSHMHCFPFCHGPHFLVPWAIIGTVTDRHCGKVNLCLERDVTAVTASINLHGVLPFLVKIVD